MKYSFSIINFRFSSRRERLPDPDVVVGSLTRVEHEPTRAHGVVVEDLPLLNEAALHLVEVEVLHPLPRAVHVEIEVVEIALLEHLELKVVVADDDLADFVEVVAADVATVVLGPVVRAASNADTTCP